MAAASRTGCATTSCSSSRDRARPGPRRAETPASAGWRGADGGPQPGQPCGPGAFERPAPGEPGRRFTGRSDARGDVYSRGLTLYELLTLRPAFGGDERHRLLERILHEEPPRPRQLDPVIPRDLETIVLKAIAKEPAHRYQTAAELPDDLRRFLEDRPVKARRASAVERLWRWARRNPTVAALAIAVAGLLTLVTVVACVAAALLRQERNTILVQKEEIEQGKDRAEKAEAAERAAKEDALEKLRGSLLAQASAGRFGGRSGRRFDGLAALA